MIVCNSEFNGSRLETIEIHRGPLELQELLMNEDEYFRIL